MLSTLLVTPAFFLEQDAQRVAANGHFGGGDLLLLVGKTVASNSQMPGKNRIGQQILFFKTVKKHPKWFT